MTKRSTPSLESMLEDLYASVCDPGRFVEFAAKLRKVMNARLVSLQTHGTGHRRRVIQDFHAAPVASKPPLADDGCCSVPHLVRDAAHVVGCGVADAAATFVPDERELTACCRQQPTSADAHWSMAFCLSSAIAGQAAVLIVNRDKQQQPFQPEDMQLAQRLLPHLRNVYALQQHLQPLEGVAAGWDFLRFGVWLRIGHSTARAAV